MYIRVIVTVEKNIPYPSSRMPYAHIYPMVKSHCVNATLLPRRNLLTLSVVDLKSLLYHHVPPLFSHNDILLIGRVSFLPEILLKFSLTSCLFTKVNEFRIVTVNLNANPIAIEGATNCYQMSGLTLPFNLSKNSLHPNSISGKAYLRPSFRSVSFD